MMKRTNNYLASVAMTLLLVAQLRRSMGTE